MPYRSTTGVNARPKKKTYPLWFIVCSFPARAMIAVAFGMVKGMRPRDKRRR